MDTPTQNEPEPDDISDLSPENQAEFKAFNDAERKTMVFAYNGILGLLAGKTFVNDPTQPGTLGPVVALDQLEITQEALDLLKTIPKREDSVGDVMAWSTSADASLPPAIVFGWLGGPLHMLNPKGASADRDYDPDLLAPAVVENFSVKIPDACLASFRDTVDSNLFLASLTEGGAAAPEPNEAKVD